MRGKNGIVSAERSLRLSLSYQPLFHVSVPKSCEAGHRRSKLVYSTNESGRMGLLLPDRSVKVASPPGSIALLNLILLILSRATFYFESFVP